MGNPAHWPSKEEKGMPEFVRKNVKPFQQIVVNFKSREDRLEFEKLVGQKMTSQTDSIWFPKRIYDTVKIFRDEASKK